MIEINLLPPQYRSVERTPLPVFLALLAGIALIGGAFAFLTVEFSRTTRLDEQLATADAKKRVAQTEADKYAKIEKNIREMQNRKDTTMAIVESKVPISIKLEQFVEIIPPDVWIDGMVFERRPDGTGNLTLKVNARGTAEETPGQFIRRLRKDANFFHHFSGVRLGAVDRKQTDSDIVDPAYLAFEVQLVLAQAEQNQPQQPRRR